MKRRSKAGGAAIKGRRRKTPEPKRSNAPRAVPRSKSSKSLPLGEETEVARLTRERDEAREQQTATGDVLKIISRPNFDLQAVLDTLIKLAARLCEADLVAIHRPRDGAMQFAANFGLPQKWVEIIKRTPIVPGRGTATGRVLLTGKAVQIADVEADPEYTFSEGQRAGRFRTVLAVPLEREGETIGVIVLCRTKVHVFTDKQIDLVQNFAAQAVIAIENARLLNELRQRTSDLTERTADLTEALDQQTATSEVLQVISSSPGDLEPVFQAMLENATRICEAKFGVVFSFDGNKFHFEAQVGTPPELAEFNRARPMPQPLPGSHLDRLRQTKGVSYTADYAAEGIPAPPVTLGGARSTVDVPMLKDNELVGAFSIYRQEVRPFTEKQIELVKNFAAQAVIAIENARLLSELRQSLEQQTATSEVLQVISSSPGDLQPVFEAMLEKAVRVCDAMFGSIYHYEGDAIHLVATHNTPAAFVEALEQSPSHRPTSSISARLLATKSAVQVLDLAADEDYVERRHRSIAAAVELGGTRTVLAIPMLKESELVGVLMLNRQEVRPFTDKQIALVTNFAAQAVIAIENARLLNELRQRTTDLTEALKQQKATSDLLQVISGFPGNLEPVFQAMLENAVSICGANFGNMFLYEDDAFRTVAMYNAPEAYAKARTSGAFVPPSDSLLGRLVATKGVAQVADLRAEQRYIDRHPHTVEAVELAGIRTALAVPMLREGHLIGGIVIFRQEVQTFSEKQIELVKNFASQVVIAIGNARLLGELRETTDEVVKLNQQLEQRVTDQVGEIERMGKLRRFLPPQVADLIVASGSEKQLESHRREITALFCDLRGFTGFTESADAEDVMALLRDYHAAIGEIIIKYNGTLERYAGDGVMVVFNDPVPVENPALQAVLMALEVRGAIGALTEKWRQWGHDLGFGIGIAHGFATLGTIGFEGRFDYAAIGTVSNVASRLCDEAKPGQILISPRVLTKVENAVKVEPVGEFELKGIRRPLAAYNVVGAVSE